MARVIREIGEIEEIIRRAEVCRVAMIEDGRPYVLPFNFGYRDRTVYIHCARKGHKLDVLRKNPDVCFEVDVDLEIDKTGPPCKWGVHYASVLGRGTAEIVDDPDEKRAGFNVFVEHYGGKADDYPNDVIERTGLIRIRLDELTARKG